MHASGQNPAYGRLIATRNGPNLGPYLCLSLAVSRQKEYLDQFSTSHSPAAAVETKSIWHSAQKYPTATEVISEASELGLRRPAHSGQSRFTPRQ